MCLFSAWVACSGVLLVQRCGSSFTYIPVRFCGCGSVSICFVPLSRQWSKHLPSRISAKMNSMCDTRVCANYCQLQHSDQIAFVRVKFHCDALSCRERNCPAKPSFCCLCLVLVIFWGGGSRHKNPLRRSQTTRDSSDIVLGSFFEVHMCDSGLPHLDGQRHLVERIVQLAAIGSHNDNQLIATKTN